MFWDVACLPFSTGGMGLRSVVLTSGGARWASWADSLHMIKQEHPAVANRILHETIRRQDSTLLRCQLQERSWSGLDSQLQRGHKWRQGCDQTHH